MDINAKRKKMLEVEKSVRRPKWTHEIRNYIMKTVKKEETDLGVTILHD